MIHTQLLQLEKSDGMSDVIMLKLDPQTGELLYDTIGSSQSTPCRKTERRGSSAILLQK
jgi:hypothetical protein